LQTASLQSAKPATIGAWECKLHLRLHRVARLAQRLGERRPVGRSLRRFGLNTECQEASRR